MQFKHNKFFSKHPISIMFLTFFALANGLWKIYMNVTPLLGLQSAISAGVDIFDSTLSHSMGLLMGVLYIFLAKWIWQGYEEGRSTLLFFCIIDIAFELWGLSKYVADLVNQYYEGNAGNTLVYLALLAIQLLPLLFYIFIIYLLTTDKVKNHCSKQAM